MYKHIFGPVPSRRLKMSLGIDLVKSKTCTLDCVYCESGETTCLTAERTEYVSPEEIIDELTDFLRNNPAPDHLTFSGSGEPMLNSGIGRVIEKIKTTFSEIPIAVLTNATLFQNSETRKEILSADLVLPSLDAGTEKAFNRINRPSPEIDFNSYIQGLIDFRNEFKGQILLEVFILPGYNDDQENILALKNIIEKIKPDKIQLNTLDRPGVLKDLKPASFERLKTIIDLWGFENIQIVSAVGDRKNVSKYRKDIENAILGTVSRRPCTAKDISEILGMSETEVTEHLSLLEKDKKIRPQKLKRGIFYSQP